MEERLERDSVVKNKRRIHKKKEVAFFFLLPFIVEVIFQFAYPSNHLLPFTNIDGINLGYSTRLNAIKVLDDYYSSKQIAISYGDFATPVSVGDSFGIGI